MTNPTDTAPAQAGDIAGTWRVDPSESHARFTAHTLAGLVKVPGRFRALAGTLSRDERGTSGALIIDAASIDTGNRRRDTHLRAPAFFGVAQDPELRYEVTSLELGGAGLSIDGELLVAGTRTRVPLAAELHRDGDDTLKIACRSQFDRLELGIRGGRGMVPRTVDIDVALLLRRAR